MHVPACQERPVWIDDLADDVTVKGSAMTGVGQDAEAYLLSFPYPRALTRPA
jgi:hypothetical protein